jgi:hypothetical protein
LGAQMFDVAGVQNIDKRLSHLVHQGENANRFLRRRGLGLRLFGDSPTRPRRWADSRFLSRALCFPERHERAPTTIDALAQGQTHIPPIAERACPCVNYYAPLRAVTIAWKLATRPSPTRANTAMIATAMAPTINAYSIAVAPFSLRIKRASDFIAHSFTFCTHITQIQHRYVIIRPSACKEATCRPRGHLPQRHRPAPVGANNAASQIRQWWQGNSSEGPPNWPRCPVGFLPGFASSVRSRAAEPRANPIQIRDRASNGIDPIRIDQPAIR